MTKPGIVPLDEHDRPKKNTPFRQTAYCGSSISVISRTIST